MPIRPGNDYWYTVTEAAQYIERTRQSVWNWISRGIIPEEDIQRLESSAGSKKAIILIREAALINAIRQMRRPKATHGPSRTPKTGDDPEQELRPPSEEETELALQLVQEWTREAEENQEQTEAEWQRFRESVEGNRLSYRRRFADE